jgi:hypothetical protein
MFFGEITATPTDRRWYYCLARLHIQLPSSSTSDPRIVLHACKTVAKRMLSQNVSCPLASSLDKRAKFGLKTSKRYLWKPNPHRHLGGLVGAKLADIIALATYA